MHELILLTCVLCQDDDSVIVMSMISELSKSVEQQELSNTVIYKLEAVEKKYQMLREIEGACSEDVLGVSQCVVVVHQWFLAFLLGSHNAATWYLSKSLLNIS